MLPYLIEYEGYRARVERDREGVVHGRVIDIDEIITFKAISIRLIEAKFIKAMNAYFYKCEQKGVKPEPPKALGF